MNLIDAVKSGSPWVNKKSRVAWTHLFLDPELGLCFADNNGNKKIVVPGDLMLDDWEIQEPEVLITKTQFWEAWNEQIGIGKNQARALAKRLGLE